MPLRLGTRASALARWQAEWVAAQLRQRGAEVELVPIATTGDQRQDAIRAIGGEGVFTKEIQRALADGRIDLAVHSLKDLPTEAVPGLALAAVPERGPVCDVLVLGKRERRPGGADIPVCPEDSPALGGQECLPQLGELPHGARVGTSSLRRRAQLLRVRPDLKMIDVRGNVETRLHKLEQSDFDAVILAEAGLRRLGLDRKIAQVLPLRLVLPAVGQGALGVESRADDAATRTVVASLDHPPTHLAVLAERSMLAALHGGCLAPIAALGCLEAERLTLIGRVIAHDGARLLEATDHLPSPFGRGAGGEGGNVAVRLGAQVAEALLAQGADQLIAASRCKLASDNCKSLP